MAVRGGYVYIMSNKYRTVFYVGVTSNLLNRVFEHKSGKGSSFTVKYHCTDLVYYERFHLIEEAIAREKAIKKWNREWKLNLIREFNPEIRDLSNEIDDYN